MNTPTIAQLMTRIERTESGCWLYQGRWVQDGYCRLRYKGRKVFAHDLFYLLLVGPLPEGAEPHHKCEQKRCVNPEHLIPLTRLQHRREHRKTHCKHGHELTAGNLYFKHRSNRIEPMCRLCTLRRQDEFRIRNPEVYAAQKARALQKYHDQKRSG